MKFLYLALLLWGSLEAVHPHDIATSIGIGALFYTAISTVDVVIAQMPLPCMCPYPLNSLKDILELQIIGGALSAVVLREYIVHSHMMIDDKRFLSLLSIPAAISAFYILYQRRQLYNQQMMQKIPVKPKLIPSAAITKKLPLQATIKRTK